MAAPMRTLIFVYNGDTGFFTMVTDIAHKLISPATYPCKLCAITHGVIRMDSRMREFVNAYDGELEFLHRDQYLSSIGRLDFALPVILERQGDSKSRVLVSSEEISEVACSEELIKLIQSRLS
jgi:hypothetical protein